MNRVGVVLAFIMGIMTSTFASGQTTTQSQPAQPSNQGTTTQQPATPAAPAGKHQPAAKTQPEFEAFNAGMANAKDPAAMEKSATDFAAKFPDSELRVLLFKQAMRSYQASNNGDKMLDMGREVLKLDPDDPEALIGVAEVLAERTRDTDLDKDQRLAEARNLASYAIETVDTDLTLRADMPPEQV